MSVCPQPNPLPQRKHCGGEKNSGSSCQKCLSNVSAYNLVPLSLQNLHIGIVNAQMATCTLPTATKRFLIPPPPPTPLRRPASTIQSKPLNVMPKEKIFLKTRRHVKASMDMPPAHVSISKHDIVSRTYDAHQQCIAHWQQHHTPYP
jgi:hypothetical protein